MLTGLPRPTDESGAEFTAVERTVYADRRRTDATVQYSVDALASGMRPVFMTTSVRGPSTRGAAISLVLDSFPFRFQTGLFWRAILHNK